jgi:hypothetical protein
MEKQKDTQVYLSESPELIKKFREEFLKKYDHTKGKNTNETYYTENLKNKPTIQNIKLENTLKDDDENHPPPYILGDINQQRIDLLGAEPQLPPPSGKKNQPPPGENKKFMENLKKQTPFITADAMKATIDEILAKHGIYTKKILNRNIPINYKAYRPPATFDKKVPQENVPIWDYLVNNDGIIYNNPMKERDMDLEEELFPTTALVPYEPPKQQQETNEVGQSNTLSQNEPTTVPLSDNSLVEPTSTDSPADAPSSTAFPVITQDTPLMNSDNSVQNYTVTGESQARQPFLNDIPGTPHFKDKLVSAANEIVPFVKPSNISSNETKNTSMFIVDPIVGVISNIEISNWIQMTSDIVSTITDQSTELLVPLVYKALPYAVTLGTAYIVYVANHEALNYLNRGNNRIAHLFTQSRFGTVTTEFIVNAVTNAIIPAIAKTVLIPTLATVASQGSDYGDDFEMPTDPSQFSTSDMESDRILDHTITNTKNWIASSDFDIDQTDPFTTSETQTDPVADHQLAISNVINHAVDNIEKKLKQRVDKSDISAKVARMSKKKLLKNKVVEQFRQIKGPAMSTQTQTESMQTKRPEMKVKIIQTTKNVKRISTQTPKQWKEESKQTQKPVLSSEIQPGVDISPQSPDVVIESKLKKYLKSFLLNAAISYGMTHALEPLINDIIPSVVSYSKQFVEEVLLPTLGNVNIDGFSTQIPGQTTTNPFLNDVLHQTTLNELKTNPNSQKATVGNESILACTYTDAKNLADSGLTNQQINDIMMQPEQNEVMTRPKMQSMSNKKMQIDQLQYFTLGDIDSEEQPMNVGAFQPQTVDQSSAFTSKEDVTDKSVYSYISSALKSASLGTFVALGTAGLAATINGKMGPVGSVATPVSIATSLYDFHFRNYYQSPARRYVPNDGRDHYVEHFNINRQLLLNQLNQNVDEFNRAANLARNPNLTPNQQEEFDNLQQGEETKYPTPYQYLQEKYLKIKDLVLRATGSSEVLYTSEDHDFEYSMKTNQVERQSKNLNYEEIVDLANAELFLRNENLEYFNTQSTQGSYYTRFSDPEEALKKLSGLQKAISHTYTYPKNDHFLDMEKFKKSRDSLKKLILNAIQQTNAYQNRPVFNTLLEYLRSINNNNPDYEGQNEVYEERKFVPKEEDKGAGIDQEMKDSEEKLDDPYKDNPNLQKIFAMYRANKDDEHLEQKHKRLLLGSQKGGNVIRIKIERPRRAFDVLADHLEKHLPATDHRPMESKELKGCGVCKTKNDFKNYYVNDKHKQDIMCDTCLELNKKSAHGNTKRNTQFYPIQDSKHTEHKSEYQQQKTNQFLKEKKEEKPSSLEIFRQSIPIDHKKLMRGYGEHYASHDKNHDLNRLVVAYGLLEHSPKSETNTFHKANAYAQAIKYLNNTNSNKPPTYLKHADFKTFDTLKKAIEDNPNSLLKYVH